MSETNTPVRRAENKNSDNNSLKLWIGGIVFAVLIALGAYLFIGLTAGVMVAIAALLVLSLFVDFNFNSTKAGKPIAKRHILSLTVTPALPSPDESGLNLRAPAETMNDRKLEEAFRALEALGLSVKGYKPGQEIGEDDAQPTNVADPVGMKVEVGRTIVICVLMFLFTTVLYFGAKSTIERIWSRKAPAANVEGKQMPQFTDDLYKQIKRTSGNSVVVPRFTDGTIWAIGVPGKDAVLVEKASHNDTFQITEGMETLEIKVKEDFPAGTKIYFVPNDGRQPSMSRPLPDQK